ncbi:MAG: sigma-70 family RNA polymerase sigma factor [Bacteroidota bacterium]
MSSGDALASFRHVVAALPFALDDVEAVNACSVRWHAHGDPGDKRTMDLWAYCFTRRYFVLKQRDRRQVQTEHEELIERTYRNVIDKIGQLKNPDRFASWVSKICKNTYINFLRRTHQLEPVEDVELYTEGVEHNESERLDLEEFVRMLAVAIAMLPDFSREIAERRLLKQQSYDQISEELDRPIATVRTYAHRAVHALRKNPRLLAFFDKGGREPPT